jgi:hypothetical protein
VPVELEATTLTQAGMEGGLAEPLDIGEGIGEKSVMRSRGLGLAAGLGMRTSDDSWQEGEGESSTMDIEDD